MPKEKDIFDPKTRKRKERWRRFKENNILMNYTVMLVPHSQKKPIHLRLPAGVLALFMGMVLTLLGCTTYWAYSAYCLKAVEAENAGLKKISVQQEQKIEDLDALAEELIVRMDAVSADDTAIREKVGLTPQFSGVGGAAQAYVAPSAAASVRTAGDLSLQAELAALAHKLAYAQTVMDKSEENMKTLDVDVDARLYYLASVPDGWPVSGARYTSGFGVRNSPFETGLAEAHSGIDLACEYGTQICAAGRGTVVTAAYQGDWGNVVILDHGFGYQTLYAHLSDIFVGAGDEVGKGEPIGLAGSTGRSTGTHLHFSMLIEGEYVDPLDTLGQTDDILDLN